MCCTVVVGAPNSTWISLPMHGVDDQREALVGHVHHLRAGARVDQLAQQVLAVALPARAEMHGLALRELDQLLQRFRRRLVVDEDQVAGEHVTCVTGAKSFSTWNCGFIITSSLFASEADV